MSPLSSSAAPDLREAAMPQPYPGVPAVQWQRAVAAIDAAQQICLACHVSPDGDALGSMLAVALALHDRGRSGEGRGHGDWQSNGQQSSGRKRIVASFGDNPPRVPGILRFLPGLDLISSPDEYPGEPEVMITFDAASAGRLGALAPNAARARALIVVDHHASNTRFGTIHLVDPSTAATAVLACELIDRLGVALSQPIALGLYAGLVTDTGSFKNSSTTVGVHRLAVRLLATGIEPEAVARELWDRAPFGYLRVLSAALARAVLEPREAGGLGLVWTAVPKDDRTAHGLEYDMVEPVIDVVRRTQEAEVAVVLKQDDAGAWQVSARSKGNVDVGRACAGLGGGGHAVAAGFTSPWPVEETIKRLRELLSASPAGHSAPGGVPPAPPQPGLAGSQGTTGSMGQVSPGGP
ncbi:MAG: DHH family phosphoesterase [Micromonosporaceae bacterium]